MRILFTPSKNIKVDSTCKFLKQRHNAYIKRQLSYPKEMRNPIPQKVSFFEDILTLIGVLPIKRSNLKQLKK